HMNTILEDKIALLPEKPGVYKMLDDTGTVIYVGKAKILKNRVRQYFQASKNQSPKVRAMVSHIADFETIEVHSEVEALSLESNLIKEFLPKYNILLKDDKHFPYFRIDLRQDFPRIEIVRRVKPDGATYLGPYIVGPSVQDELRLVYDLFPIRHCKKNIAHMQARGERPCLLNHVGKCCAPCSGNISREQYHSYLQEAIRLLNGRSSDLIPYLTQKMQEASDALDFERAAMLRDKLKATLALREKQVAISANDLMADVFAVDSLNDARMVFSLFVRGGKVIGTHAFPLEGDGEDSRAEWLHAFLLQYYGQEGIEIPPLILLEQECTDLNAIQEWLSNKRHRKVSVTIPQRGVKHQLTDMAKQNCTALLAKNDRIRTREWERGEGALAELSGILGLDEVPSRIECFDNSHLMGTNTVASMVVFRDGKPDKTAYRHFRIRADAGGDDLIAMKEVLSRRLSTEGELPDLIVLDGGKTQLAVGVEVLSERNLQHIPICALAESDELIYLPEQEDPILIPKSSAPLHLIERLRDEAHRFAISYHRNLRSKSALYSVLDSIDGIGDKRKRALYDTFITVERIKAASVEELASVKGMTLPAAQSVYMYFHPLT
ncbi:MAG: excinuclease ABC subunit UvrC, partial [Clostridia bacterium]|nr:excinuclease ABC subunit UvrC [Clostridia bacterium]